MQLYHGIVPSSSENFRWMHTRVCDILLLHPTEAGFVGKRLRRDAAVPGTRVPRDRSVELA
eukprot:76592-Rhodomonas_salina.1